MSIIPPEAVVRLEPHGAWSEVVLNRPERRNAIVAETVDLLRDVLGKLADDGSTTAVVLRGEGGVFCSGLDLGQPPGGPGFAAAWAELHLAIAAFPVLVVGALERAAVAAGASLALACDLLVAGDNAFLSVPELAMGRPAPMNTAWLLYKHGPGRATELVIGGKRRSAADLLAAGLAFEVVPDQDVRGRACEVASTYAGYNRAVVVAIKNAIRSGAPRSFEATLRALS